MHECIHKEIDGLNDWFYIISESKFLFPQAHIVTET